MNYRSLLVACLATLGLAVASWAQADGKIAFISDREGYGDVWIMNGDGSDPVNLTQGRHCASPAWSPDGTKIAYIYLNDDSDAYGQYGGEIWLMDADGGNPQQLTDDSVYRIQLSWSEDGSSIYYSVLSEPKDDGGRPVDSFVMALDGSGSSPVAREAVPHLHYGRSPDGTKGAIVVLRDKGDAQKPAYLLVSYAGDDEHSVIPLPALPPAIPLLGLLWNPTKADVRWIAFPAWAPDSMRMAFVSMSHPRLIWAVDLDGGNLVELTNGLGGQEPTWQPAVPAATSVESQSWGRIKSLLSTGSH